MIPPSRLREGMGVGPYATHPAATGPLKRLVSLPLP